MTRAELASLIAGHNFEFNDEDLSGEDLMDLNLSYKSFLFANLRGANLEGANLKDADVRGADFGLGGPCSDELDSALTSFEANS